MSANVDKQISADSDFDNKAYVAFLSGGTSGQLKIAKWLNTGTFDAFETASTSTHSLPTISITSDEVIHVYTINSGAIKDTKKFSGAWTTTTPLGTSFTSPEQLTGGLAYNHFTSGLWIEGTSAPYDIRFGSPKYRIVTSGAANSPSSSDYYEGERRIIVTKDTTLYAFYYDGSNIVYKYSVDNGYTWTDSSVSLSTGTLGSDNYRWTITTSRNGATEYITFMYYKPNGANTDFYAKTYRILGPGLLALVDTNVLFSVANHSACNSGTCAAATATIGSDGRTIWGAFRYLKDGSGAYQYRIFKSVDDGLTWTTSLAEQDSGSSTRIPITITPLTSGKMLFVYVEYGSTELKYSVYGGASWGSVSTTSGAGAGSGVKQISSDSTASNQTAYVAYTTGGTSGTIKVAKWSNTGSFESFQTAESTLSHTLPSIVTTPDGSTSIYSLASGKVYETKMNGIGQWMATIQAYGSTYDAPDELTAAVWYGGAMWREGSSSYSLKYGGDVITVDVHIELHNIVSEGTQSKILVFDPATGLKTKNPTLFARAYVMMLSIIVSADTSAAVGAGYTKFIDHYGGTYQLAVFYVHRSDGSVLLQFAPLPSQTQITARTTFVSHDSTNNCYKWVMEVAPVGGLPTSVTECIANLPVQYTYPRIVAFTNDNSTQFSSNTEFTENKYSTDGITFSLWSTASASFGIRASCVDDPVGININDSGDSADVIPPGSPNSDHCSNLDSITNLVGLGVFAREL